MAIEFSTPSFKPREYEGEYIRYTLYGLDSDGDELDDIITSPKKSTVIHTIKELRPDYRRIYNGMHVTAILYDKNDRMLDSEVVWSTDQDESKGISEAGVPSDVKDIATYLKSLNPQTAPVYNAFGSSSGTTSFPKWYSDTKKLLFPYKFYSDADMNKIIKQGNAYISKKYGEGAYELTVEKVYSNAFHSNCYAVRIKPAVKETNGADEESYTVYSLDDETGSVSKDGVYPTWRKAYAALADGTVWDKGSSNNFVFHGNHLQQIYKYKKTGRTGKWSGNGYDVIFDREISEDPADYIKAHFTPTRYNACRFNESAKSYVLAHKGPNDTTYCKNKAGDWTTHIEDAWEGSGPDSFSAEMKRNFADAVHCAVEDLEVIPVEKFEAKGADEKLSYEKGHKNSKGEDAPWVIRSHKDDSVLASFPTKKEAENHMKTMKRYSKTEGKFTEIKAAIKAAWSAAEAKWFRLDFREATERLDVYPIASDNEGVGVNWGVLPERNTIVQYATDLRTGDNQIEREMSYKDLDELEKIFVDEFKSMDETLEVGADNGADIHPLTENRPTESEVDKFLYNALDWASIDDGKNRIILKFVADAGSFDLIGYDGSTRKTLKSGELFSVVDRYRELVEMDQADAIREFEKE